MANLDIFQNLRNYEQQLQIDRENEARRRTFRLESLFQAAAALVAAPFTGGASMAWLPGGLIQAAGEGLRASTGGDRNYLGDVSSLWDTTKGFGTKTPAGRNSSMYNGIQGGLSNLPQQNSLTNKLSSFLKGGY